MEKWNKWILCLTIFGLLGFSGSVSAETTFRAVRTSSPPVLDGKLTDACWEKAAPVTGFKIQDGNKPAARQTIGYVLYDDNNIYIGLKCLEPETKNIKTAVRKRDEGTIYGDDCVELMLDPALSANDYLHFAVNASGSQYDRYCREGGLNGDVNWNGKWKSASFIGEDYWSCEVTIPFLTLGITPEVGSTWGINLCRENKVSGENSSIAEMGAFNVAGRFARITGLDANLKDYCYRVGEPDIAKEIKEGKLYAVLNIPVENSTGGEQRAKIEGFLAGPDGKVQIKSNTLTMKPGEKVTAPIGPFVLDAQGEYQYGLIIADAKTGSTRYLSETKLDIRYVPMAINLIEPFYRDAIFATQKMENIVFEVKAEIEKEKRKQSRLYVKVEKEAGGMLAEKEILSPEAVTKITLPCSGWPDGKMRITAVLKNVQGESAAETSCFLQKLAPRKGEVWLGRDGNWYVDGKKFFYLASWGYPEDNNPYYAAAWGNQPGKKSIIMLIFSVDGELITQAGAAGKKLPPEMVNLVKERIKQNRDNPDFFAYHTFDEVLPPLAITKELYQLLYEEDPYHPVIVTHDSLESLVTYMDCADQQDYHCYPVITKDKRINDLSRVVEFSRITLAAVRGTKFVSFLDQAFNYGDYGRAGDRIHNYYESRGKMFLALICGANGVTFYNRGLEHYPELYIGAPYLAQELSFLGKAFLEPDSTIPVKTGNDKIKTRLKEVDGELYLFVSNADMEPGEVKITVPGISSRSKSLAVVSEDRNVPVSSDSFTDKFDTFEVHVYTTSKEKTGLLTVNEICKKIEAVNQDRKKPGNLAFQMFEGD
ncbi:MAG: carbohydrate binding family 9 domain-containing protein, partial [Candidatus Omnitrophica bacterium]|nr:carbohydrate binding family 9 domain-containing protein [Candidatus Omnitrophota bacterium]